MPNKLLQAEVLKNLQSLDLPDRQFNSVADITQDDMKLLTDFSGSDTYIDGKTSYSLEGLQYATNLTKLSLNQGLNTPHGYYVGDVTDISPLAALTKLTDLDISQNRISDIAPLADLTNLTSLNVQMNQIADLSPLKNLTKLTHVVYGSQFIMEPPVYVDASDPTATLVNNVTLPDGSKPTLISKPAILQPIQVSPDNSEFYYKFYFNGAKNATSGDLSNVVADGDNLTFNQLVPQIPGFTGDANGQFVQNGMTINVVPVKDNFYLVAQGLENGTPVFQIIQPYVLAAKAAPVTVTYVDRDGKQLADPTTLSGLVGQPYATTPATIAGYSQVEIQGAPSGTFTADPQTVTYVYEADVQPVTVKYQDEAGNQLSPDVTLTGKFGAAYTTEQKDLPGYTFVSVAGPTTGAFGAKAATVTYVYTATVTPITVKYVDEQENPLREDILLTGKSGESYQAEQLAFPGYSFVKVDGPTTGTLGATGATVTYTYQKDVPPVTTGTVTVHYEDADGQPVAPNETLTGDTNTAYTTAAKDVPGYILIVTPANAAGNFTDGNLDVTYVYQTLTTGPLPEPTPEPGNGVEPAPAPTPGHGGESVPAPQPTPTPGNGGTSTLQPAPAPQPTAPATGGSTTSTATSNSSSAPTPSVPDQPTPAPQTTTVAKRPAGQLTTPKQPRPANAAAGRLPQTGDRSARWTGLLGLLAGILSFSWLGVTTKRRKHN